MTMTTYERYALAGYGIALLYVLWELPKRMQPHETIITGNTIVLPEDAKMAIWADENGIYMPGA